MALVIDESKKNAYLSFRGTDVSRQTIISHGMRDLVANDVLIFFGVDPNRLKTA